MEKSSVPFKLLAWAVSIAKESSISRGWLNPPNFNIDLWDWVSCLLAALTIEKT